MCADPVVQNPYSLQSHNRYSYVMNNPLGWVDPSGYEADGFGAGGEFGPAGGDASTWGEIVITATRPESGALDGGSGSGWSVNRSSSDVFQGARAARGGGGLRSASVTAGNAGVVSWVNTECSLFEKAKAFFEGAWSVASGTGNSLRFIGRGTYLLGVSEQDRWSQEGQAVDEFIKRYNEDEDFRLQVNQAAATKAQDIYLKNQDGELKWFVTGRAAVGMFTGLGPAAFIGDVTRAVENGHNMVDSLIRGGILGKPQKP